MPSAPFSYPPTHQDDVTDVYHDTAVSDPFRWLETPHSEETQTWITAQNNLTRSFLDELPIRETIQTRLTQLWNYPRQYLPTRYGNRYFLSRNNGLQNQSVIYMQETLDDTPQIVLDPNLLRQDGTAAITSQAPSHNGRKLAYGISYGGSDSQEIRVRDIDTGQEYPEVLKWCRFAAIAWKHDGSGFFYNRDPEPTTDQEQGINPLYNRLYWHTLNTPQTEDKLIYHRPDAPKLNFPPTISEDGNYLILHVWHAAINKNRLYYQRLQDESETFVQLIDEADASCQFIGNTLDTFYIQTDRDAPNGRIVAINLNQPEPAAWQEIIPEQNDPIAFCRLVHDHFVVVTMHHAHHRIYLYQLDGSRVDEIILPTIGTITNLSGERADDQLFIGFESFLYPHTIFRYDFNTATLNIHYQPTLDFNPDDYTTRQIFYHSVDGTRVPMFLTHRSDFIPDGSHPTLLSGYGGFNISITPTFNPTVLDWIQRGGVRAVANLRGGGEYGEAWHQAGMLSQKQNVFDDFITAAEWLINNNITQPKKLGIIGGSNGGLLVAACMLQRPKLFGAVVSMVPVIDMLRYHKFTAGRYWVAEYGNAEENQEHFQFMMAYSPLHNIQTNITYPPILITTADTDDRVVPMHAKKFAAALQTAVSRQSHNPILLRVDVKAGHGLGKPITKVIEESSDIYTFLWATIGAA